METITKCRRPAYQNVDGLLIPEAFSPDIYRKGLTYQPKEGDLFIVTFPKCGTTWTQTIVSLIFAKGDDMGDIFKRSPSIELMGLEGIMNMSRPGSIKTHLPFNLTPYSPLAKYIYVARNPKDVCVSFYHHTRNFPFYRFPDGTFDDFFQLFLNGETEYGDYLNHLLEWFQHRNDPNVLFLTYEDMKKDFKGSLYRIARFIGSEWEEMIKSNPEIEENICLKSSVGYMREKINKTMNGVLEPDKKGPHYEGVKHLLQYTKKYLSQKNGEKFEFVRKGIVGDWKNYFSDEQNKALNEKMIQKLGGTGLLHHWDISQ